MIYFALFYLYYLIMKEKLKITTSDGIEIVGNYMEALNAKSVGLLLHMMPSVKESWEVFAEELASKGFSSLAIDLRGHGESTGGPEGYKNFTDKDHQNSIFDVMAAVEFLESKGAPKENIFLAGASIGANLSLQYQKENPEIRASILLSPGLDYRGILGGEIAKKLKNNQAIFIAGSEHDCGYRDALGLAEDRCASDMARDILKYAPVSNKKLKIFSNSAHGTTMLARNIGFTAELIEWLNGIYE